MKSRAEPIVDTAKATAIKKTMEEEKAREEAEARRQRIMDAANDRMEKVSGFNGEEGKSSTSSKLAAMRRRRFKKKDPSEETATEDKAEDQKQEPPKEEPKPAEPPVQPVPSATEPEERKYQGVAKIRRRLNKEKAQQEDTPPEDKKKFTPRKKPTVSKIPILMHALTAILLFVAGLDVGLQQAPGDFAVVHTDYAPKQYGFRVLQFGNKDKAAIETGEQTKWKEFLKDAQDEFAEVPLEENIDPLFRVDLDALTEGPGIFMMMARFAVKVHRSVLYLVFYLPLGVVKGLYNLLLSMVETPPILCLAALTIRQLVGKTILGAKLPEKVVGEQKDVMSMVKKFVGGFIQNAFPTGVTLYDAWTHLRSDMYVVMFGMLVGLALTHATPLSVATDAIKETVEQVAEAVTESVEETVEAVKETVEAVKESVEEVTMGVGDEL